MGLNSLAQEDTTLVREAVNRFITALETDDHATIVDLMHPALMRGYSPEKMTEALEAAQANNPQKIYFRQGAISNISDVATLDGTDYVLVSYTCKIFMQDEEAFEGSGVFDQDEYDMNLEMHEYMHETLVEQYGDENVLSDPDNFLFEVFKQGSTYAIKSPEFSGWKLLELNKSVLKEMPDIIPKRVKKQLQP